MKPSTKILAAFLLLAGTATTAFAPPLPGDVDLNNYVSAPDVNQMLTNWAMVGPTYADGDVNGDGFVNVLDLALALGNWGAGTFVPLAPAMQPTPGLHLVQVIDPKIPAGYLCWDVMIATSTNLGVMELIFQTYSPGDIYQHPIGLITEPDPALFSVLPPLEFDTYVTSGAWPYQTPTIVIDGAIDIQAGSTQVFDGQTLNISWSVSGGSYSGPGSYQVARITVATTAHGHWDLAGWESGNQSPPSCWEGGVVNGVVGLAGDVDGDGWVSGTDLSIIISYWGQTGLGRQYGDLNGDGWASGPDYTEVLSYWGTGSPPPPEPIAIPEPATLGLLLLGGLALFRRRLR